MNFMNLQVTRRGKLQLELTPGQVRTIAAGLIALGIFNPSPQESADAAKMLEWIKYRARRRWGAGYDRDQG
jgi:hypothetical protein